jgi:hypothetical protein
MNGGADPIVVRTADFKPILESYIQSWRANEGAELEDPVIGAFGVGGMNGGGTESIVPAGAIEVLAEESGIRARRILAIRKGETHFITLATFDALITAMGMPMLAQELTLYRNPLWGVSRFITWLGEQGLTPEDVRVRRVPPPKGWHGLELAVQRVRAAA